MNLLGLHLQLLVGETVPAPAPLKVSEALQSVEVTHKDEGRSGFQVVFQIGRGALDLRDYALLKETRIRPFNRVLLNVLFGVSPLPIMDGIITNHQLAPGDDPGTSKLTVTGEDLSVMMDLEKQARPYPNLSDDLIVFFILLDYLIPYGIRPDVQTPTNRQTRTVDQQTTTQPNNKTDLEYLNELAGKHGFVFYVEPGPVPGTNVAYWGPPSRRGRAQGALSINMGPNTNVESISFKYDELTPKKMTFTLESGNEETVERSDRTPPLATRIPTARKRDFLTRPDGMSDGEARSKAQGEVNKAFDQVVTANGTLDALRYGRILKPRGLVDVRGAGEHYDGTYYVKSVTHKIDVRKGEYKQTFALTREGVGTTTPFVST
ncbi:MAG: hypothetical protein U9Q81_01190 [Pseudomonadota bacterium]|nr:hypothetical protein [Pseudomonadota bacterium]